MRLFKRKDRNKLNQNTISDVLIGYSLNLMGKSKEETNDYLQNVEFVKENTTENETISLLFILENECVLGVSIQEDKVFKLNIWLNQKPSENDLKNLELFHLTHENEYIFYTLKDTGFLNRHLISLESKIY